MTWDEVFDEEEAAMAPPPEETAEPQRPSLFSEAIDEMLTAETDGRIADVPVPTSAPQGPSFTDAIDDMLRQEVFGGGAMGPRRTFEADKLLKGPRKHKNDNDSGAAASISAKETTDRDSFEWLLADVLGDNPAPPPLETTWYGDLLRKAPVGPELLRQTAVMTNSDTLFEAATGKRRMSEGDILRLGNKDIQAAITQKRLQGMPLSNLIDELSELKEAVSTIPSMYVTGAQRAGETYQKRRDLGDTFADAFIAAATPTAQTAGTIAHEMALSLGRSADSPFAMSQQRPLEFFGNAAFGIGLTARAGVAARAAATAPKGHKLSVFRKAVTSAAARQASVDAQRAASPLRIVAKAIDESAAMLGGRPQAFIQYFVSGKAGLDPKVREFLHRYEIDLASDPQKLYDDLTAIREMTPEQRTMTWEILTAEKQKHAYRLSNPSEPGAPVTNLVDDQIKLQRAVAGLKDNPYIRRWASEQAMDVDEVINLYVGQADAAKIDDILDVAAGRRAPYDLQADLQAAVDARWPGILDDDLPTAHSVDDVGTVVGIKGRNARQPSTDVPEPSTVGPNPKAEAVALRAELDRVERQLKHVRDNPKPGVAQGGNLVHGIPVFRRAQQHAERARRAWREGPAAPFSDLPVDEHALLEQAADLQRRLREARFTTADTVVPPRTPYKPEPLTRSELLDDKPSVPVEHSEIPDAMRASDRQNRRVYDRPWLKEAEPDPGPFDITKVSMEELERMLDDKQAQLRRTLDDIHGRNIQTYTYTAEGVYKPGAPDVDLEDVFGRELFSKESLAHAAQDAFNVFKRRITDEMMRREGLLPSSARGRKPFYTRTGTEKARRHLFDGAEGDTARDYQRVRTMDAGLIDDATYPEGLAKRVAAGMRENHAVRFVVGDVELDSLDFLLHGDVRALDLDKLEMRINPDAGPAADFAYRHAEQILEMRRMLAKGSQELNSIFLRNLTDLERVQNWKAVNPYGARGQGVKAGDLIDLKEPPRMLGDEVMRVHLNNYVPDVYYERLDIDPRLNDVLSNPTFRPIVQAFKQGKSADANMIAKAAKFNVTKADLVKVQRAIVKHTEPLAERLRRGMVDPQHLDIILETALGDTMHTVRKFKLLDQLAAMSDDLYETSIRNGRLPPVIDKRFVDELGPDLPKHLRKRLDRDYVKVPDDELWNGLNGVKKWGSLAGKHIDKATFRRLTAYHDFSSDLSQATARNMAAWRAAKLLWNPGSWTHHIAGAGFNQVLHGGSPHDLYEAAKVVGSNARLTDEFYLAARASGAVAMDGRRVADALVLSRRMQAGYKDFAKFVASQVGKEDAFGLVMTPLRAGAAAYQYAAVGNPAAQRLGRAWATIENFSRYAVFKRSVERLAEAKGIKAIDALSDNSIVSRAADEVARIHVPYEDLPIMLEKADRLGLAPFARYTWAMTGVVIDDAVISPMKWSFARQSHRAYEQDDDNMKLQVPFHDNQGRSISDNYQMNWRYMNPLVQPQEMISLKQGGSFGADLYKGGDAVRNAISTAKQYGGLWKLPAEWVVGENFHFEKAFEDADAKGWNWEKRLKHTFYSLGPGFAYHLFEKVIPAATADENATDMRGRKKMGLTQAVGHALGFRIEKKDHMRLRQDLSKGLVMFAKESEKRYKQDGDLEAHEKRLAWARLRFQQLTSLRP